MGMLTDKELVIAFINNTSDRDWDVNPSYSVDQETARAIRETLMAHNGRPDLDCALRD